jgi:hypothetical protein
MAVFDVSVLRLVRCLLDVTLDMLTPTTTIYTVIPLASLPKRSCHRTVNALVSNLWKEEIYILRFLGGKKTGCKIYRELWRNHGDVNEEILEFMWG